MIHVWHRLIIRRQIMSKPRTLWKNIMSIWSFCALITFPLSSRLSNLLFRSVLEHTVIAVNMSAPFKGPLHAKLHQDYKYSTSPAHFNKLRIWIIFFRKRASYHTVTDVPDSNRSLWVKCLTFLRLTDSKHTLSLLRENCPFVRLSKNITSRCYSPSLITAALFWHLMTSTHPPRAGGGPMLIRKVTLFIAGGNILHI